MKRVAISVAAWLGWPLPMNLRACRVRRAVQVVLFEASSRLGGTVETVHEGGFVIEGGPDGWVSEKPWASELRLN